MNHFEPMTTGDLRLCINLLEADAVDYENMCVGDESSNLRPIITVRRELAEKMAEELRRREAA